MIKNISRLIEDKNVAKACDLFYRSKGLNSDLMKTVSLLEIKSRISSISVSGDLLFNTSLLSELASLSKFSIVGDVSTTSLLTKMKQSAQDDFSILSDIGLDALIHSVYESMDQFFNMSFDSFAFDSGDKEVHKKLHYQELDYSNKADLIADLQSMEKGFYLVKIASDSEHVFNDSNHKSTRYIVSNQSFGVFFAAFEVKERPGYSLKRTLFYENPFFSDAARSNESELPLDLDAKNTVLYKYSNDKLYSLSFLCYLIANNHEKVFDYDSNLKLVSFNNDKDKLPVLLEGNIRKVDFFELSELELTGEYQHMSYLDDRFGALLSEVSHLVNFDKALKPNEVLQLRYGTGPNAPKHPNEFIHKLLDTLRAYSSIDCSRDLLRAIPKCSFMDGKIADKNSSEAYLTRIKQYAMYNKMVVYGKYIQFHIEKDNIGTVERMEKALSDQVDLFIPWLKSLAEKYAVKHDKNLALRSFGISEKNSAKLASEHSVMLSSNPEQKYDFTSIRSFTQKAKAHKVVRFSVDSFDDLLEIMPKSFVDDELNRTDSVFRYLKTHRDNKAIAEKKGFKQLRSDNMNFNRTDPELLDLFHQFFEFSLPLSKSQLLELSEYENIKILPGW